MIRKAGQEDALAIAQVHVNSWKSTYKGLISDAYLDSLSVGSFERFWADQLEASSLSPYVAETGSGIVGFVQGGPLREKDYRYQGEIYSLYLLKSHQRKGLGKQLVQAVMEDLITEGMSSFLVWVLADNPSCGFYEKLGGKKIGTKQVQIGGNMLQEVAYGWERPDSFTP